MCVRNIKNKSREKVEQRILEILNKAINVQEGHGVFKDKSKKQDGFMNDDSNSALVHKKV